MPSEAEETTMSESSNFIDIPKGYRRLGKFPLDSGSVIEGDTKAKALETAKKYAKNGSLNGTAYVGQVIAVVSKDLDDYPELYTVNDGYDLVPVAGSASGSDLLSGSFDGSMASGSSVGIRLPAGMIINTISIKIYEAFGSGQIYFAFGPDANLTKLALSDGNEPEVDYTDPGDYVIKCTVQVTQTDYLKFFNSSKEAGIGSGYIKIN